MSDLRVFAFSPAWGLPTTGPFALKLLAWLRLAELPYELVHLDDTRKGPKGKSPWIEDPAVGDHPLVLGDTELIIRHLRDSRGVDPDAWLDDRQRATALAWQRMIEEHLHQVYEHELIVQDAGFEHFRTLFDALPVLVRGMLASYMRSHFRKQLQARGVGRHSDDEIAAMGIADVDALVTLLGDGPFLLGERPCSLDAVAYGFLAPMIYSELPTPTWSHARSQPTLRAWADRLRKTWFPDEVEAQAA